MSNAFKYAPGKPVLMACRQRAGKLSIGVYDMGRGIPATHLPHLCNEFIACAKSAIRTSRV